MSSISYTAKHFTKEDEKREIQELTDAEKEAILDDLYGRRIRLNRVGDGDGDGEDDNNEANNNNNDDDVNNENENIDVYDDDDIPPGLMRDLMVALERLPSEQSENFWFAFLHPVDDIFETECNLDYFLRWSNYNADEAAKRICEYWNMRVKIFGEACAYYSILKLDSMIGENVIVPYLPLIPNLLRILPNDRHGRTVLFSDPTNVSFKDYDDKIILQIVWFVVHKALQRRSTQENGVVLIFLHKSSSWDAFPSLNTLSHFIKSMNHCMPLKICGKHLCISSLFASLMLPIAKYFVASRDGRQRIQLYNSLKIPTMLNELETFGLHRNDLPISIGGTYDEKPTWVDECERILKERRRQNKRQRVRENTSTS